MIDNKKCKGTGIAKGNGCHKTVPVSLYGQSNRIKGLGKSCGCYSKWLLTTKEGQEMLNKATIKAKQPRKQLSEARSHKKEFERLGTLIKNTVIICHKYIRERDKYKSCISCGEAWNDSHQAGHFYKAELFSSLKFNEDNINGQCVGCNIRKEGNESQYRVNLPNRIGQDNYNELNRLAILEKQTDFKWSRTELNKIREYYKLKLKQL
jgi:hypothetical protein